MKNTSPARVPVSAIAFSTTSAKCVRFILAIALAAAMAHRVGAAGVTVWSGGGSDQHWSTVGNWTSAGGSTPPAAGDSAIFGQAGASGNSSTVTSIVDAGFTSALGSLVFTNTGNTLFQVTQIPLGSTLTVSGSVTNGGTLADAVTNQTFMTGGGMFTVTGTPFQVGNFGSTASTALSILDMSGLSYFVYNNSSGTFNVGEGGAIGGGTANRPGAILRLAGVSNNITAATINFQTLSGGNGGISSSSFNFGAGTNIINVGTFNIVTRKNSGNAQFAAATGGLRIRGVNGNLDDTSRATITVADVNGKTGTTQPSGNLALSGAGHPVDIKAGTVMIGRASGANGSAVDLAKGLISFDAGTMDATTILMAICSTTSTGTGLFANGTLNVSNNATAGTSGNLIVGAGGISLVNATTFTGTGLLNVNGGTVTSAGSIVKTTANGVGNVTLNNSALTMAAGTTVGTPAIPIDILTLSNATLQLAASFTLTNIVTSNLTVVAGANNTVNISSLPIIGSYPSQIALIKYTTPAGDLTAFTLGSLPASSPVFQGYISNNTTQSRIDLVITNGPVPPPASKALTWDGEVSGDWDTATLNWTTAGAPTNYNNVTASGFGDTVTFDDTLLGTTNINLTTTLSPGSITVNNTLSNYFFTGSGKISGAISLTKQGPGTLTIANTGSNDFSGPIALTAGTLLFNQSVDAAAANAISGAGSLVKNNLNTLTLSGNNGGFSGGVTANAGTLRLTSTNSPGTAAVIVNNSTAVVGVSSGTVTNSFTLNGATLGVAAADFVMSTNAVLTAAANTTNILDASDPQNPVTSRNIQVDAVLAGSGAFVVKNADAITNPDGNQGVRFRNSNSVSSFSGTIIVTNNSKSEIQVTGSGPFTPIGTGKFILYAGAYVATNGTGAPATGGYLEFNIRNTAGSTTIPTDFEIAGTGSVVLNGVGSPNGAVATLGNLKIGNNQELIGYRAAGTTTNSMTYPTVTLTGGNATFSPHSTTFGVANQAGTDFSLGPISEETAGSGITMAGLGNLTLTGVNTYTGDTVVKNGVLFLNGSASIAGSPNIVVGGGARFDVSTLSSTFPLGAAQTLSNSSATAVLNGNADASVGTVSLRYAASTPSFTVTNGALTLASGTTLKVNNTGAALGKGSYKIISAATAGNAGSVAGVAPSSVAVSGNGLAGTVTPSAQINGNELFVVVPNSPPVIAKIVTNSTSAGLTWKIAISNLTSAAGWSDPDNDAVTFSSVAPTSNLGKSVTSDGSFIYYNSPVSAEDFFTYTISDGTATANGTVYLETVSAPPAPATANQIVRDANGVPTITFAGIPGRTNVVEASSDLENWTAISTNVAGTNGLWQVIDSDATNFVNRFYRSYQPYP
jgi:fibronectin-binding autotransporter adhesin